MSSETIIRAIAVEVERKMGSESSGHDWWHVYRVWKTACHLAEGEKADRFVVELAALLHDIADWKFHGGDDTVGPRVAREIMEAHQVDSSVIEHVCDIIAHLSFKGAGVKFEMGTIEGKVVQDADRLDAIGAIGIARAFAYGGHKGKPIYEPGVKPTLHQTKESYQANQSSTVNHFYEKLLLLKDLMNTRSARQMAEGRHRVMEEYLRRFLAEWSGKR
jgi:uncharacterized protein